MSDDPEYRVVCPDGIEAERLTGPDAEHWARLAAASSDVMHDGARCIGPHRVERSLGWEAVQ